MLEVTFQAVMILVKTLQALMILNFLFQTLRTAYLYGKSAKDFGRRQPETGRTMVTNVWGQTWVMTVWGLK
jgi:hypothetical protein